MATSGQKSRRAGSAGTRRSRRNKPKLPAAGGVTDVEAMFDAVYPGDPAVLRQLLRAGADPDTENPGVETVLELAAANADCPAIARMLVAAGATVTPLAVCRAAKEGAIKTLALLLRAGGDPNARMPFFKSGTRLSALNVIEGDHKTRRRKLELLLAAGADVNRADGMGMPVAVALVDDTALADRVFSLANAAARKRILNRALVPHGTEADTREHMLHVARLFLGAVGLARQRQQVTDAIDDHLAKRPGAQARFKKLLTVSGTK